MHATQHAHLAIWQTQFRDSAHRETHNPRDNVLEMSSTSLHLQDIAGVLVSSTPASIFLTIFCDTSTHQTPLEHPLIQPAQTQPQSATPMHAPPDALAAAPCRISARWAAAMQGKT